MQAGIHIDLIQTFYSISFVRVNCFVDFLGKSFFFLIPEQLKNNNLLHINNLSQIDNMHKISSIV